MPDRIQDARVGLAGPFWGLGAAATTLVAYFYFQQDVLVNISRIGAWINLFNLIPFWQLDGGRGVRSLNRIQRWWLVSLIGLTIFLTHENLLLVLLGFAIYQSLRKNVPLEGDEVGFLQFIFLIFSLSALCLIHTPQMN